MPGKSKRGGKREAAFTDAQVHKIRELAKDGKSIAEIAESMKQRPDTVGRVVHGKSYKHLLPGFVKKERKKKVAQKVPRPAKKKAEKKGAAKAA